MAMNCCNSVSQQSASGAEPGRRGSWMPMRQRNTRTCDEVHAKVGNATVEDAAECIDHIAKVAGIDHVWNRE